MFLLLITTFFAVLVLTLWIFYVRKIRYRALSNIPGPPSNYIWGNLFDFNKNIEDSFDTLVELNKHYGPVVKLWTHPWRPLVVVSHPKFIEKIISTNSNLGKSTLYRNMKPFLGNSLVTSNVETWKRTRKFVNPAFQPKIFEDFIPTFEYHGKIMINILRKQMEKSDIDLPIYVDLYVLDVICEIITNVRTHFQEKSDDGYLEARSNFLTIFMNRAYSWVKRSDLYFSLTGEYASHKKSVVVLKNFSKYILKTRKDARKLNSGNDNCLSKTVLDLFLDAGVPDHEALDHIDTFIVAGHDTPGSTIAFALYEIAQNPTIQKKVLEESVSILGKDPNVVITVQDTQNMTYLECVIKETLRHHTTIPAHERLTDEDITIDGITIPEGTEVSIAIYALHHDEEYYPNPHVFDPDRFLPENSHKIQNYTFIPFTKGPRDCIGKTMAMMLMKWIITTVIRNFELLPTIPPHKLKLTSEFVLKSANGLPVRLKQRTI